MHRCSPCATLYSPVRLECVDAMLLWYLCGLYADPNAGCCQPQKTQYVYIIVFTDVFACQFCQRPEVIFSNSSRSNSVSAFCQSPGLVSLDILLLWAGVSCCCRLACQSYFPSWFLRCCVLPACLPVSSLFSLGSLEGLLLVNKRRLTTNWLHAKFVALVSQALVSHCRVS